MKHFHKILMALLLITWTSTLQMSAYTLQMSTSTFVSNEEAITFEELPVLTQHWIKDQFSNQTVTRASYDAHLTDRNYEVTLSDNTILSFDEEGKWSGIQCADTPIPETLIPSPIQKVIKNKYPGTSVSKMRKEAFLYKVVLNSHQLLVFDQQLQLVENDTDGCYATED